MFFFLLFWRHCFFSSMSLRFSNSKMMRWLIKWRIHFAQVVQLFIPHLVVGRQLFLLQLLVQLGAFLGQFFYEVQILGSGLLALFLLGVVVFQIFLQVLLVLVPVAHDHFIGLRLVQVCLIVLQVFKVFLHVLHLGSDYVLHFQLLVLALGVRTVLFAALHLAAPLALWTQGPLQALLFVWVLWYLFGLIIGLLLAVFLFLLFLFGIRLLLQHPLLELGVVEHVLLDSLELEVLHVCFLFFEGFLALLSGDFLSWLLGRVLLLPWVLLRLFFGLFLR